jgi:4-nitrophenyl phosphatase
MNRACRKENEQEKVQAILSKVKCFILDLDGTVYLGGKLLDGAIEFLEALERNKIAFKFFTNNSSKNAKFYINKIHNMGYKAKENAMLLSSHVIIRHLQEKMPGKKVFLLGNEYLKGDFQDSNINLVEEDPDVVVVGFDTTLVYENVAKACTFIRKGAIFLGVHPDFNCPTEDGFIPDCGSICAMITASTGVLPEYFGKPTIHTLQYLLTNTGFKAEEIAVVGDRLYTDIAIGKGNGLVTILVLSGETKLRDLQKSEIQPTLIFDSLKELKNYFS